MPDPNPPTVKVSFDLDAGGHPKFEFVDDTVRMTAAGIVVLIQAPGAGSRRWKFVKAEVKDDTLDEFHEMVLGAGNTVVIDDLFRDDKRTSYSYYVKVKHENGTSYQSPDPVIVNDPEGVAH